jgi:hypothetical protein
MYCLVRDDDSHWFVIPKDREEDWFDYLDSLEDEDYPEEPEWAVSVGGSASLVVFPSFNIGE